MKTQGFYKVPVPAVVYTDPELSVVFGVVDMYVKLLKGLKGNQHTITSVLIGLASSFEIIEIGQIVQGLDRDPMPIDNCL